MISIVPLPGKPHFYVVWRGRSAAATVEYLPKQDVIQIRNGGLDPKEAFDARNQIRSLFQ